MLHQLINEIQLDVTQKDGALLAAEITLRFDGCQAVSSMITGGQLEHISKWLANNWRLYHHEMEHTDDGLFQGLTIWRPEFEVE